MMEGGRKGEIENDEGVVGVFRTRSEPIPNTARAVFGCGIQAASIRIHL